jgi:hypothetical protein
MLKLIRQKAAQAAEDNPYLGHARARELREQLAAAPEGVPDLRRWLFHKLLGRLELRLGNIDASIQHYLEAHRQLDLFAGEIPEDEVLKTIFEIGVAYMRMGETENCALRHTGESCIFPIGGAGVHQLPEGSRNAIRYFQEILDRTPSDAYLHLKARWLLNIAYMTLGTWPDAVPRAHLLPPRTFESDEPFPRFPDIAPGLGLNTFDLAGGAVAADFSGNGFQDIVTTTSDASGQMRYFVNNGDGSFTERTTEAGLTGLWGGLNMIHADHDNDGDVDLLVLRGAWWKELGRHPNSLIRNNGDGTFTDVTFDAGLAEVHYPTQTAAWGDYDNDGDLDLYVGNETSQNLRAPCQLFRNEGDGTFADVAAAAGVENLRYAKAVAWGDYDGDRWPDLYVSNIGQGNRLYRNNGDGTFTDVAEAAGVTGPVASFPIWFWDYDNDGVLDLWVGAYGGPRLPPDVAAVVASYLRMGSRAESDRLYRGDGRGGFVDVSEAQNLSRITLPMGCNHGDLDNDGYLDFYLGTGYPYYEGLTPNVMFRNREGRGFADVTTAGGFGHLQKGHGVIFADLDHDGDQDLFEQMGGFYPGDAFGNLLFENPGFGNHWIKLELVGVTSNRFGVGARIRLDIVEDGRPRSIYRHVGTGGSFGGNPLRQEIGVGRAERIETLEIYWPTSDRVQTFHDVAADRLYEVAEDAAELSERTLRRIELR